MALIVRYLSQPYAGREIVIPEAQDEVRFGRAAEADIGFPVELDIVSRDHFRLRREVGVYKFVISRELPVFSGGRPVLDGEELDAVTEIQLSGPNGPRLRIERQGEAASNLAKTQVLKRGQDIGDIAIATKAGGRRQAQWLVGLGLAAAVLAGGYFWLSRDLGSINATLPSIAEQVAHADAAASGRIDAAGIAARNKESVYQVQLRLASGLVAGTGTASVVQMPDGTKALATNAHVAAMFLGLAKDPSKAGARVFVVQPKGPDYPELEVVGAVEHPAYELQGAFIERMAMLSAARVQQSIRPMSGYDVGLLFVADPSKLGTPLTYASREKIAAIRTGEPLLMIGYPAEGLRGTDQNRPEPTTQAGIITAMTTFYLFKGSDADNQLIQHSVPATGGASGSPMFNVDGEVVGFLNSGNVADVSSSGARMPSAALVNYAMRADMLLDMVDGTAESKLPHAKEQMAEAEARYALPPEAVVADIATLFGAEIAGDSKGAIQIVDTELALDQALPDSVAGRYVARELNMEPGFAYLVLAASLDGRPVNALMLGPGGDVLGRGADFAYLSYVVFDNSRKGLPKLLWAVIDVGSVNAAAPAAEPGKVRIRILKARAKQ